ncbi:MAG: hypothetical protein JNJ50_00670 [Acidobacteria bacterium]|mgnify:CR=1 FL=1|nr:hypothetical protein [Acidobacteriota bacterium]
MKTPLTKIERRIRVAGLLIIAGLLVELVTLHWSHPTAFLFFLLLGGTLMGLGIILFLLTLVSAERSASAE